MSAGIVAMVLGLMISVVSPLHLNGQGFANPDRVTKAFRDILVAGDTVNLKEFFADSVLFEGDGRFLGASQKAGRHTVSRDKLIKAFAGLLDNVGQREWSRTVGLFEASLQFAQLDHQHHPFAKAGDYVFSLAKRGALSPEDDTLVFVFRKISGTLRIVAHYGDY